MKAHQLRIAIASTIRQAMDYFRLKAAWGDTGMSFQEAQAIYNPIALANILEGAHGWPKDSLGSKPREILSRLRRLDVSLDIKPELLDFNDNMQAPITKGTLDKVHRMLVQSGTGVSISEMLQGLWNTKMMPSGSDATGFMDSDQEHFWYKLGKDKARLIKSGDFTMNGLKAANTLQLRRLGLNVLDAGKRKDEKEELGAGVETYGAGRGGKRPTENRSLPDMLFGAIYDPDDKWHKRANEWFFTHVAPKLSHRDLAIFDAYQTLGYTPEGGIRGTVGGGGAYWSVVAHIKNKIDKGAQPTYASGGGGIASFTDLWAEYEQSGDRKKLKAWVKKGWDSVKKRFPEAFEDGLHDASFNDLMNGLSDEEEYRGDTQGNDFFDRRMVQMASSRVASRHAYRQTLRLRKRASASTKNADYRNKPTNGAERAIRQAGDDLITGARSIDAEVTFTGEKFGEEHDPYSKLHLSLGVGAWPGGPLKTGRRVNIEIMFEDGSPVFTDNAYGRNLRTQSVDEAMAHVKYVLYPYGRPQDFDAVAAGFVSAFEKKFGKVQVNKQGHHWRWTINKSEMGQRRMMEGFYNIPDMSYADSSLELWHLYTPDTHLYRPDSRISITTTLDEEGNAHYRIRQGRGGRTLASTKTAGFRPPKVNKTLARLVAGAVDKHWHPKSLEEISGGIAKGVLTPMDMRDLIDNQDAVKKWAYGLPRGDLLNVVRWVYEINFRGRRTQYNLSDEYLSGLKAANYDPAR